MSYCDQSDPNRFFEGFDVGYYGTYSNGGTVMTIATTLLQADIDASYSRMNVLLDAVDRIPVIPIGTSTKTGSYNPALVEWNALDTIFTRLRARHSSEFNGNLPQWMRDYGSRCAEIYGQIVDGHIPLDTDTTNKGIGYPVAITKVGKANFYTNWDTGFYSQSDFPKTYRFKITGSSGTIGEDKFKISYDDGYTYDSAEILTDTGWIDIEYGLKIRWENYGTLSGTQTQLVLNDEYQVYCVPTNTKSVNAGAQVREFKRG
jgi:hypothetical protein